MIVYEVFRTNQHEWLRTGLDKEESVLLFADHAEALAYVNDVDFDGPWAYFVRERDVL